MRKMLLLLSLVALAGLGLASLAPPAIAAEVSPPEIDWQMAGTDVVRFHLRFHNPDPLDPTGPVSGSMHSQEFGVFLPDYGLIGTFNVPPIEPESFFDVFFDVPLSSLPPNPGSRPALSPEGDPLPPCPPIGWFGNVDVNWSGPGGAGQVNYHFTQVGVYAGGAPGCVHVITQCAGPASWVIGNVCQGWIVTLVNEDFSPAPNPVPANWTGHVCVWAPPGTNVGTVCCPTLDFTCAGVTARINVCAQVCDPATPARHETWGRLKMLYR